jgi:cytochrome c oxidase assembly protein subunit 15
MSNVNHETVTSPWPHRWAVVLACATFPLLWVGGLVTTTEAGMAFPDWPTSFGYNPLLYPWTTWLAGPWDLFIEHGHRLLAGLINLLTLALVAVLWRVESRAWVRWLGAAALGLVLFQDVLGGMRVVLIERTLAMIHGIVGPLFFAVTISLVVFTSRAWRHTDALSESGSDAGIPSGNLQRLAVATCVVVYLQMILGAVLRHVPAAAEPATFFLATKLHLTMAAILTLHIVMLVLSTIANVASPLLGRLAIALGGLLFVQLLLGAGTWVVKYAVPSWTESLIPFSRSAIVDGGWLQTHVVTAHVAVGSLLLATSVAIALYSCRQSAAAAIGLRGPKLSRWEAAR